MENLSFFEIEKLSETQENALEKLNEKKLFFSYFRVDQKYYILVFNEQSFNKDFLYKLFPVIEERNSNVRRIRSFRGFLLLILNLFDEAKTYQELGTNLTPFFWSKIRDILKQNKNPELLKFLFGDRETKSKSLEQKIIDIEKEIRLLKQKKIN